MRRYVQVVKLCCLFLLALVVTNSALAKVIHVPADQPTIQSAINVANSGDKVLVAPGTYKENIDFLGKNIAVVSSAGASKTIIDGGFVDTVAKLITGESRSALLTGFTLQNGAGYGAVDIENSSPTVEYNVITGNQSCYPGTIINVYNGGPLILGNLIASNNLQCFGTSSIFMNGGSGAQVIGNAVVGNGGGIAVDYTAKLTIEGNYVSDNGYGIAVYGISSDDAVIIQNLITHNRGQGITWGLPPGKLVSNTIANNSTNYNQYQGSEIYGSTVNNQLTMVDNLVVATGNSPAFSCDNYDDSNPPRMANNDTFAASGPAFGGACPDPKGKKGNISADPLFVSLISDDYHLQASSPAIDSGTNAIPGLLEKDFDGDARVLNQTIDIGADEYSPTTALVLSSHFLNFGSQDSGSSSPPQIVTLTNNSASPVNIRLIATGAEFTQVNNCGSKLAAGASCQMSVRFSPTSSGEQYGALAAFTDATPNPLAVELTGNGVTPNVFLNPQELYFGSQIVGTQGSQPSTLTNNGQAPLTIYSVTQSGSTDFSQTNDCPMSPHTLAPGGFCTFTVTWSPTIAGQENTNFSITDDAPGSPQVLEASGQAYSAGIASLSPTELRFPDTLVGGISGPQNIRLTNTGTGPLGSIYISTYWNFPETNDCPSTLAVGASCTITIIFAPPSGGLQDGGLNVFDDAYSAFASLTGNGIAPVPTLSSLSPGSVLVGSYDTQVTVSGANFMPGAQVFYNGTSLYTYFYGSTQLWVTIPASYLMSPGRAEVKVFNPGPGGGYSNAVFFTVYEPINSLWKSIPFRYTEITGTNLNLSYYGWVSVRSPFPIQFGGGSFDTLGIAAGGTISPGSGFNAEGNEPLPTYDTPILIAPMWSQLYPWGTGNDYNVFWQVNGNAPDRQLIVEWRDVPYCCSDDSTDTVKFQVVFFEGSGNILFNYADTTFGGQYSYADNGAEATVGMQVAPTMATQYSYDTPSLHDQMSLLWYPDAPAANLSTTTLDFGYHLVGTTSTPQKFTLTNGSLVPLQIAGVDIDNPDFSQQNNCGNTVPPGKSCTFLVTFTPSQPSAENATLSIMDNATNSPQTVTLSGIGASTPTVIFPVLLNFGNVSVGQNKTLPVTLANALNSPMTIEEISTSPSVYTQTNNCGSSLPGGASCTISVTFTPTQKGSVPGKLSMGLNGKPTSAKVKLTGTGN